ncbi:MAG: helix-turn-helix transcriptional regulator [Pseudomonadota bacterium]
MPAIEPLARWNRDIAKAITQLGNDKFFPTLIEAILRNVKADYPQVWLYHRELPPQCIYHEVPDYAIRSQIDLYLDGPYQEDPFYKVSMRQARGRFYRLSDLMAGKFETSSYYHDYYRDTATEDEVMYLARLRDGNVINISLMRKNGRGRFSKDEFRLLHALSAPVTALIKQHSDVADFSQRYMLGPDINDVIDLAFHAFGSSLLSPREKSVLELMLRGYSSHASADKLGIAIETLRRHRKSIYRKLDVNSQTDLFSLFIATLPYLGQAGVNDPLTIYLAPPQPSLRP